MSHVVVIGAGLAGLSAACHLAGAGRRVTVLEAADHPGGRNGTLHQDGFTFDTGPSVLTMPNLVDEALQAVGSSVASQLTMKRLDPAYRALFSDGSTIHIRHGHQQMRDEIEQRCNTKDAQAFDGFVDWLGQLYELELPNFIDANFNTPLDLFRNPLAAAKLVRLGGFGRLGHQIRKRFDDSRLHRIFSFQAMYAGLSPDEALGIYAVITYMDSIAGVYFPEGGMRDVPHAMARAAERVGVEFRYSTPVSSIERRSDGTVVGVGTESGEKITADAVVCTLDVPHALDTLLPDLPKPRVLRNPKYSPSCVVWHLGVKGSPAPETAHHNIHFGDAWSGAFDDLLKSGTLMRDPSRLVCIPSKDDASAAPEGHSTLFVLEPVPNLAVGQIDWNQERGPMRERLLRFLQENDYPTDIVTEQLVTPLDWQAQGMAGGTPFALAHTFLQTGPFRPPNVRSDAPGLVFAGSGTVPGVGIPMVLISGKLAAQRVAETLR